MTDLYPTACFSVRLAREAGLEYVEIQNLTEFYDDNRFVNNISLCKFMARLGPLNVILLHFPLVFLSIQEHNLQAWF